MGDSSGLADRLKVGEVAGFGKGDDFSELNEDLLCVARALNVGSPRLLPWPIDLEAKLLIECKDGMLSIRSPPSHDDDCEPRPISAFEVGSVFRMMKRSYDRSKGFLMSTSTLEMQK